MNMRFLSLVLGTLGIGAALLTGGPARTQEEQPQGQEGVEVLARGPVHEAFAEPSASRPEPGPVVRKQPPELIDELPPDQKPAGDDVLWLPGYWAWDDEASQYLWVSGFWRVPPPGQRWVPGTWQQVAGGWQWVAGFWAPQEQEQVTYLPAPPEPLETGPSVPAPERDSVFVPGCWVYRETRYLWRPGFWVGYRPDWVWMPAHYCWTPAGFVFVDGYWDRPLHERGLLFAPVRFTAGVVGPRFRFTPGFVVHTDFLLTSLFVGPTRQHYFFGDYFDEGYGRRGFTAWVDFRVQRFGYDPNFSYYRHRFDNSWERGLRSLYVARRTGDVPRPPRTLVQQNQVVNNITVNKTTNVTVNKNINITNVQNVTALAPLKQVNNTQVTNLSSLGKVRNVRTAQGDERAPAAKVVRLEAVSRDQQAQVRQSARQFNQAAQERRQTEAKLLTQAPPATERRTEAAKPQRVELPKAVKTLQVEPREKVRKAAPPPPRPTTPQEERPAVRTQPSPDRTPVPPRTTERRPDKEKEKPAKQEGPQREPTPPRKETNAPPPPAKNQNPPPADKKGGQSGKGDGKPDKGDRKDRDR